MIQWYDIKEWLLMKALSLAKNRQGLVQVERLVTKRGKTFNQHFWIRPDEVKDNDKVVGGFQNLPKGHSMKPDKIPANAKVPQEIRDIVTAYQESYLKTRPDKKSADEAFFNDLRANGISWDEHPMPLINMMRAKMAVNIEVISGWKPPGVDKSLMDKAKQYIRQNNATPQPHRVPSAEVKVVDNVPKKNSSKEKIALKDDKGKDESLLEVPDNATPAQKEIIKFINQITDLQEIKKCALMGIVPEDDTSKNYILDTMIPKMYDWIFLGTVQDIDYRGTLRYGDKAPEEIRKRFMQDCNDLNLHDIGTVSYPKVLNLLEPYLQIPKSSKFAIFTGLGDMFTYYYGRNTDYQNRMLTNFSAALEAGKERIPDIIEGGRIIGGFRGYYENFQNLNSAFSNYVIDNPKPDELTNLGYTGNDLERCKAQYDCEKEGYVRYLRKLQSTYPNDTELSAVVEDYINKYDELMKTLNYNHNLFSITLKRHGKWKKDTYMGGYFENRCYPQNFYSLKEDIEKPIIAETLLKALDIQYNAIINSLSKEDCGIDEIMAALSDTLRNDSKLSEMSIVDRQGNRKTVDCTKELTDDDRNIFKTKDELNNLNTYTLAYFLMRFQEQHGIAGTPQGEKYLSHFRKNSTFQATGSPTQSQRVPENIKEYIDYLTQVSTISDEDVFKARTLAASLYGLDKTELVDDVIYGNNSFKASPIEGSISEARYMVLANTLSASMQHEINTNIIKKLQFEYSNDTSKKFSYYSANLMNEYSVNQGITSRVKQCSSDFKSEATYTSEELSSQIQRQLDNIPIYSQEYVSGLRDYVQKNSIDTDKEVPRLDKGTIGGIFNQVGRDLFFNILTNVASNVPQIAQTPNYAQKLAESIGYVPFDSKNPQKSKKAKKPSQLIENVESKSINPSPIEIKEMRQKLYDRAMGTIATEATTKNDELMTDFRDRFDYEPGEKTPEGKVVKRPVHKGRVAIFNSPFFAIKNTVVWEDRFKTEQERMKKLGLDEDCYRELNVFHACARGSIGGIIGRDQGWFMGDEYTSAGKMLGVGAYWAYMAGKSAPYCGDNPYSMLHKGTVIKDTADGVFVLASIMRGENPKRYGDNKPGSRTDLSFTSSSVDMGNSFNSRPLNDWEIAVRNNALILPRHIVDVSCRCLNKNVLIDSDGNYTDLKGNIIADSRGVRVSAN